MSHTTVSIMLPLGVVSCRIYRERPPTHSEIEARLREAGLDAESAAKLSLEELAVFGKPVFEELHVD